jgi:CBS domain-containing protein
VLATEIMIRDVVTVTPDDSLRRAAVLMLRHGINGLPVVEPDGRVVGMVGIRDVLRVPTPSRSEMPILKWDRLDDKARELARTKVGQVLARRVVSVDENATVVDVAALMANRGVHPIPILRDGRLVGLVARADVVRTLLKLSAESDEDGTAAAGA